MQAVRTFEGDSSLQFKKVTLRQDPPGTPSLASCIYQMQHNSYPTVRKTWSVNAYTSEVKSAYYGSPASDPTENPVGSYSQSQCLQAAQTFVTAKYADFAQMSFQLSEQTWTGYAWQFLWRQKVAYDTWTPNSISIEVNPHTGQVKVYSSTRIPTPTPTAPTLTAAQAVTSAKQATGIVTVTTLEGPMLECDPAGNTAWSMMIIGTDAQSNTLQYVVVVNAVTGAIIESTAPMD